MTPEAIEKISDYIETRVKEDHEGRGKRWNAVTGQWLVYGFERKIGFCEATALESVIERAHKSGHSVKEAAMRFFMELSQERAKANV